MILDQIKSGIKTSLLAGDRFRVETLKMAQSALTYARIAKNAELSEAEEIAVIQKEIKKRKEAAEMYAGAKETERANKELAEIVVLEEYVPKMLSGVELVKKVEEFVASLPVGTGFPDAMKRAVDSLGNVDKSQLAGLLKSKLG